MGNLTEEERRVWRSWVTGTRVLSERIDRRLREARGISHSDFEILDLLVDADGSTLRMNELAEQSVSSRSRLSHQIKRLEKSGLVERTHCPVDGRGVCVTPTRRGRKIQQATAGDFAASIRESFFKPLTQREIDSIIRTCDKLTEAAGPGEPEAQQLEA